MIINFCFELPFVNQKRGLCISVTHSNHACVLPLPHNAQLVKLSHICSVIKSTLGKEIDKRRKKEKEGYMNWLSWGDKRLRQRWMTWLPLRS